MPVTSLAQWQTNMATAGAAQAARLAAAPTSDLNSTYYDGARVFAQLAEYLNATSWFSAVGDCIRIYRDGYVLPNNGQVNGYTKFTRGLRRHFERTGDPLSKQAVLLIATNGAYSNDIPLSWTASPDLSREVAYTIQAYIDSEALGAARRSRRADLVNQAYGHIDQWLGGSTVNPQPFMMALSAYALIQDWLQTSDARLLTALTRLADFLWPLYRVGTGWELWLGHGDYNADLNLIVSSLYAFLYAQTRQTTRRDQFNQAFTDGVAGAYLADGKHFDQNYIYSFDAVRWIAAGDAGGGPPTGLFTVALNYGGTNPVVGGTGVTVPLTAAILGLPAGDAVQKVEFWWGTNPPMATVTQAPWTMQWNLNPTWTPVGSYDLKTKVTTVAGATATSLPVTVQVVSTPPPPPPPSAVSYTIVNTAGAIVGGLTLPVSL